jgi:hypothetical protein
MNFSRRRIRRPAITRGRHAPSRRVDVVNARSEKNITRRRQGFCSHLRLHAAPALDARDRDAEPCRRSPVGQPGAGVQTPHGRRWSATEACSLRLGPRESCPNAFLNPRPLELRDGAEDPGDEPARGGRAGPISGKQPRNSTPQVAITIPITVCRRSPHQQTPALRIS